MLTITLDKIHWKINAHNNITPKKKKKPAVPLVYARDTGSCQHGGLESTEIQKKIPGFVTHIF